MICTARPLPERSAPQRWLDCTLEEINAGCCKSVPRATGAPGRAHGTDAAEGASTAARRELTLRVAPGAAAGTRFVFPGQAVGKPGPSPGDLVYELREVKHPRFERCGDDLLCSVAVPLHQALTGAVVAMETLDGRMLRIPAPGVLAAGAVLRVAGEGLCGKGDLLVRIDVHFPEQLSERQRGLVRAALFLPAEPSAEQAAVVAAFLAAFQDRRVGWASRNPKQA
ncbi:hypothetical protein WJX81_003278 [Elliptochloris bilobata]|uniref:Chaperone DnaJ C-terminal domain-containing protein n=1 Tax=Elliptochloris bilobata TaxID=381761 RepID=A0AAW1S3Y4_9CHLO